MPAEAENGQQAQTARRSNAGSLPLAAARRAATVLRGCPSGDLPNSAQLRDPTPETPHWSRDINPLQTWSLAPLGPSLRLRRIRPQVLLSERPKAINLQPVLHRWSVRVRSTLSTVFISGASV